MSLNTIENLVKLFKYYKGLGDRSFQQIPESAWHEKPDDNSISLAVIVRHLHGNMLSRWTDFLSSDGEKSWRQRDKEFENPEGQAEDFLKMWEEGWACLFNA